MTKNSNQLFTLLSVYLISVALTQAQLQNYNGTEIQKCLNCLCHARSGCYSRFNCSRYSIDLDYWKQAGSPVLDQGDDKTSENSFKKCMANENCIYATIDQYTVSYGQMDCNCDGAFDCKDRLAIHLKGKECTNPQFGRTYARRFNQCANQVGVKQMLDEEGFDGCQPEVISY